MTSTTRSDAPLVSVIIPCYNAAAWVEQTIQSCFDQTYRPIEVIVIDDGSTDDTLSILKGYGDAIILDQVQNIGANAARNHGMALSHGAYIQFLDADDYLMPEKFERQVRFLEESGADAVYSDYRYLHERGGASPTFSALVTPGEQDDILETLLSDWDWWVHVATVLYRREAVVKIGGWDVKMYGLQDRDFLLSIVLSGSQVRYLPGDFSVYRRQDAPSLTANKTRWMRHRVIAMEKAEQTLLTTNRLTTRYRQCMAAAYFRFAHSLRTVDYDEYLRVLKKVVLLDPGFRPHNKPLHSLLQPLFGLVMADVLIWQARRVIKRA